MRNCGTPARNLAALAAIGTAIPEVVSLQRAIARIERRRALAAVRQDREVDVNAPADVVDRRVRPATAVRDPQD